MTMHLHILQDHPQIPPMIQWDTGEHFGQREKVSKFKQMWRLFVEIGDLILISADLIQTIDKMQIIFSK